MKRFWNLPPLLGVAAAGMVGVGLNAAGWVLLAVQSADRWYLAYPVLFTVWAGLLAGACVVPVARWHAALLALAAEAEGAAEEGRWVVAGVRVARLVEGAGLGDSLAREARWRALADAQEAVRRVR